MLAVTSALAVSGCVSVNASRPGPNGMMGGDRPMRFGTSSCTAPRPLPGTRVRVVLGDMGRRRMSAPGGMMGNAAPNHMMLRAWPEGVPAGQVSFVAVNRGWRIHELVVLPLAANQQAGQRTPGADGTVEESSSLGEASKACGAGEGDGIEPGTTGWVTLRLAPGRYELICNRRNHYVAGMYQELVVR